VLLSRSIVAVISLATIALLLALVHNQASSQTNYCSLITTTPRTDDYDCDGIPGLAWSDSRENYLGTKHNAICPFPGPGGATLDTWPPDVNKSGSVNGQDWLTIASHLNQNPSSPGWSQRYDLNQSSLITGADMLTLNTYMNKQCGFHYGLTFRASDVTSPNQSTLIQYCTVIIVPFCTPYAIVNWHIGSSIQGQEKNTYVGQTIFEHSIYIYDYCCGDSFIQWGVVSAVDDELCGLVCSVDGTSEVCSQILPPEDTSHCRFTRDPFLWVDPFYLTDGQIIGTSQQGYQVSPGSDNWEEIGHSIVP